MKKTVGRKSRDTVPLTVKPYTLIPHSSYSFRGAVTLL
jgi:hypothetical protein